MVWAEEMLDAVRSASINPYSRCEAVFRRAIMLFLLR